MSNPVATSRARPIKITREWFRQRYGQNFPDLLKSETDDLLDSCIDEVYTMFFGVADLWVHLDRETYCDKTRMCYGLLVAWYITDLYPNYALGVVSSGGIPIAEKVIGGVKIKFSEGQKASGNNAMLLNSLKSNAFGAKAYMMIESSAKKNLFVGY